MNDTANRKKRNSPNPRGLTQRKSFLPKMTIGERHFRCLLKNKSRERQEVQDQFRARKEGNDGRIFEN